MMKRSNNRGQTALVITLLTAGALIFYAVSLNWGHIAQTKTLLTIAADQAASTIASEEASLGEMYKDTDLGGTNETSGFDGILIDAFLVLVAIAVTIFSFGTAAGVFAIVLAVISTAMAVANLVLQLAVVQPGITSMWNKEQQDQSQAQQFYEAGITSGLEGAVADQVDVTDYFDSNTNGSFGLSSSGTPNDLIGRFSFYYSERLRMLNKVAQPLPGVLDFYNQLSEFLNGESCAQNVSDNLANPNIPLNPACSSLGCDTDPNSTACTAPIPGGFQLSDACVANSDPTTSNYTPYCDPCCQPAKVPDPLYNPNDPFHNQPNIDLQPSTCTGDSNCSTNNPSGSTYLDLYDPTYQNYGNKVSFLAQFGRDIQMIPKGTALPMKNLTLQGDFPNGIYPFFWLMSDYSPEVDNITASPTAQQYHWCTSAISPPAGYTPPDSSTLNAFPDLVQLSLPNACNGNDCCVGYLETSVSDGAPATGTMKIDMVGSSSAANPNPATSPDFGEGYGSSTTTSTSKHWITGDNQMCVAKWPYNGRTAKAPDGTCETTPTLTDDSLDDTMHTLSDFSNFAATVLNMDAATLNKELHSWFPQAEKWIAPACSCGNSCTARTDDQDTACNQGKLPGRLLQLYNVPGFPNVAGTAADSQKVDILGDWNNNVIVPWLNQTYTHSNAWCLPDETTLLNNNTSTLEDTFINANSGATCPDGSACPASGQCTDGNGNVTGSCVYSVCPDGTACPSSGTCSPDANGNSAACVYPTWGSLPSVIACLYYNAGTTPGSTTPSNTFGPVTNYTACQQYLASQQSAGTCPKDPSDLTGTACDPTNLGRSLISGDVPKFNGKCDTTLTTDKYITWLNNSITVFNNEQNKFLLRAEFLNDIYTRAVSMQNIFRSGESALASFLAPCGSSTGCTDGGPAAQLIYAYQQAKTNANPKYVPIPNAVIYGWTDIPVGSQPTYSHLVKVTAYSPGRKGNAGNAFGPLSNSQPPWVDTWETLLSRYYALTDRDGVLYVSIKRWDEDHSSVLFPNTHVLWQQSFHNPNVSAALTTGQQLMNDCTVSQSGITTGFGILPDSAAGMQAENMATSAADVTAFKTAFMLNDNLITDNGKTPFDPVAAANSGKYNTCLSEAAALLANAPESHACAEFIASSNPTPINKGMGTSQDGDSGYTMRFIDCSVWGNKFPDDLTGTSSSS